VAQYPLRAPRRRKKAANKRDQRGVETCKVAGCASMILSKELCHLHYYRQLCGRPIEATHRLKRNRGKCVVRGCKRKQRAVHMCSFHYNRRRRGQVLTAPKIRAAGTGSVHGSGYVIVAGVPQHRTVMEARLGRPLRSHENVHHRNGIRHDNRPSNLELWTRKQPPGKRVSDLIKWCKQFLEEYNAVYRSKVPRVS
jgi:hypothetical protein